MDPRNGRRAPEGDNPLTEFVVTRFIPLTMVLSACAGLFDSDTDAGSPFPVDTGGPADSGDTAETGDTGEPASPCPDGLEAASNAVVSIDQAQWLGSPLELAVATLGDSGLNGATPVCASEDGLRVRALLSTRGRAQVSLELFAPTVGSPSPEDGVTIDGFGLQPATRLEGDDITVGTWGVQPQGGTVSHTLYVEAQEQGRTLVLRAQVLVLP
jgi:hypothetical protein